MILASGLFAEEIIHLALTDLDLDSGQVNITGDDRRERQVRLDRALCEKACRHWLQAREQTASGVECRPHLFITQQGASLSKRTLYKIVSEHMMAAGMQKARIGPEVLRQTAIWNMFQRGLSLEEVRQNTGIKTFTQLEKYQLVIA